MEGLCDADRDASAAIPGLCDANLGMRYEIRSFCDADLGLSSAVAPLFVARRGRGGNPLKFCAADPLREGSETG
jgi:hypothetical protein